MESTNVGVKPVCSSQPNRAGSAPWLFKVNELETWKLTECMCLSQQDLKIVGATPFIWVDAFFAVTFPFLSGCSSQRWVLVLSYFGKLCERGFGKSLLQVGKKNKMEDVLALNFSSACIKISYKSWSVDLQLFSFIVSLFWVDPLPLASLRPMSLERIERGRERKIRLRDIFF